MHVTWLLTFRSLLLSIVLHIVLGGVLIFSFQFSPSPTPTFRPPANIIKAVSVDKKQVELELKRLKDKDNAIKAKELKLQKDLEKKTEKAKQKLNDIKRKKEKEEQKRKLEKTKKIKAEKERKKLAAKKEKERKRKEAERKAEKERKQKELEKAIQDQIELELETEQNKRDQATLAKYFGLIKNEIQNNFNRLGLPEGLSCLLLIRMLEGGNVIEASIVKSSGNGLFDRRAVTAVYSASPLPVTDELRLFNKMRILEVEFIPK